MAVRHGRPFLVSPASGPPADPPPDPILTPVVTPALIAAQTTTTGREIHKATIWNGRLYLAYGDYNANTGPIHVLSLDLTAPTVVIDEATLTTEETWTFRALGSRMFVPFIDPQGGIGNPENGQYAVASTPGTWATKLTDPYMQHVMGVVETADGLFLFGATDTEAKGLRSTDDGATWTEVLTVASTTARFYGAMIYGTTIVAVSFDTTSTPAIQTFRWDAGGPFAEIQIGSDNGAVSDPIPFAFNGTDFQLVLEAGKEYGYKASSSWWIHTLPEDDAGRAAITASIPANPFDAKVSDDGLTMYLLDSHSPQRVWQGDQSGVWSVVLSLATSDPKVVCMAVDEVNGWFYFGSTDSQVLRHAIPA